MTYLLRTTQVRQPTAGRTFYSAVAPLVCLLLLAAFVCPVHADDTKAENPSQPTQWRLIWTDNPTTTAKVSWSTTAAGKKHVVHLSAADGTSREIVAQNNGAYTSSNGSLHYHHATIDNLHPDTRYEVTIESDAVRSADYWFRTASVDDRPLKLIFGGDSRSDPAARRQVNQMIARLAEEDPSIACFAHGGDFINTGSSFAQWRQWMSDHELTTGKDGRLLPIVPARGNHDIGPLFEEVFGYPSGDNNYFAINLTPQIRFITLNSEISAAGDQKKWLEAELATAREKNRFVVVQYHRPAYPAVKRPGRAKQHWVPLFEKYNVDLVCEADGHNVKRTVPIRNDKHDPSGVVYIGEGGLGVPQRTPKTDRWFLKSPGMAGMGHHVHVLSFQPKTLQGRAVGLDNKDLDAFELLVRRGVLQREKARASTAAEAAKK